MSQIKYADEVVGEFTLHRRPVAKRGMLQLSPGQGADGIIQFPPLPIAGIDRVSRVHDATAGFPALNQQFPAGPDPDLPGPCRGRIISGEQFPSVRKGVIASPGAQGRVAALATPDQHFFPRPDERMIVTPPGGAIDRNGCPANRLTVLEDQLSPVIEGTRRPPPTQTIIRPEVSDSLIQTASASTRGAG